MARARKGKMIRVRNIHTAEVNGLRPGAVGELPENRVTKFLGTHFEAVDEKAKAEAEAAAKAKAEAEEEARIMAELEAEEAAAKAKAEAEAPKG